MLVALALCIRVCVSVSVHVSKDLVVLSKKKKKEGRQPSALRWSTREYFFFLLSPYSPTMSSIRFSALVVEEMYEPATKSSSMLSIPLKWIY